MYACAARRRSAQTASRSTSWPNWASASAPAATPAPGQGADASACASQLRAFASRTGGDGGGGGVAVALVNMCQNSSVSVALPATAAASAGAAVRRDYVFTPCNGDITDGCVALGGVPLHTSAQGELPTLTPALADAGSPLVLPAGAYAWGTFG